MALFKISRGSETNLPKGITDGYAYFCADSQNFYIDFVDSEGVATRKKLGVEYAEKLRYSTDGKYVEINPTDIALLSEDNTFTGNNTFSGKITVSHDPTDSTDAVNKAYLDSVNSANAQTQTSNTFVGDNTFKGKVTISKDPVDTTDAANKKYVDATVNASKLTWKGEWTFKQDYVVNDVVGYKGSCYVCVQSGLPDIPSSTSSAWGLIASKGDTGSQGQKGDTGAKGADGSKWYTDEEPSNANIGDFYLRADDKSPVTSNVYALGDVAEYTSSGWTIKGNIRGPQGTKGDKGDKGDKGADGELPFVEMSQSEYDSATKDATKIYFVYPD